MMILIAVLMVLGGIVAGYHGAGQLRRLNMSDEQRSKALAGYLPGFAIWICFGIFFAFSASWILAAALFAAIIAIYLPSIVILLPIRQKPGQDRRST